jgi:hypothetical protein
MKVLTPFVVQYIYKRQGIMNPLGGKESRQLRFFLSRFVKKITYV